MHTPDEFVVVHRGPNPTEHLLMKSVLEGNGIKVRLEGENATGAYPEEVGELAESRLYVRAGDAESARQIIAAARTDEPDLKADTPQL